MRYWGRK